MTFVGKASEHVLAEAMKEKFKLVKNSCGYAILSICDMAIKVATQLLAWKVTWRCHADEVLVPIVALAAQCAEGVPFNWACYLCSEFLVNCHKVKDLSKAFHYAWLLFSIVLGAWELPEDSKFPSVMPDLPKATKYTSLWVTKDPQRVKDKITNPFWHITPIIQISTIGAHQTLIQFLHALDKSKI